LPLARLQTPKFAGEGGTPNEEKRYKQVKIIISRLYASVALATTYCALLYALHESFVALATATMDAHYYNVLSFFTNDLDAIEATS
jgi:hypothetical protein